MNKKILGILSISLFVGNQAIGSFCGAYANVASICVIIISGFIGFYSWKLFDDEREEVKKEHLGRNQELVECIQMWQNTTLQKIEKMIENSQKQMDDMNAFQGTVEAYGKESLDCYRQMQEELKRLNDKLKDIVTTELNQEENNHKFYIDFRDTVTQSLEKTRDILEKSYTDITESINSLEENVSKICEESKNSLSVMVEESKDSLSGMVEESKNSLSVMVEESKDSLSDMVEESKDSLSDMVEESKDFFSDMVEESKESVLEMANDFKKSVQKQERDLQGKLSDSMEELQEEIKNFSSQIQGFREAMNRICDQVTSMSAKDREILESLLHDGR
ncbi:MAG: apolipoprotein A1/A4/E family protein [Lachnospiraceae bacterium]|nr:apolipoprotein A1/A4/E family protein [Lachnospiraceae bacterium]